MTPHTQTRQAAIALSPVQSTVQITKELNMAGYNKIDRVDYQEALIQIVEVNKPQIAIISSELPGRRSIVEMMAKIAELSPATRVIYISKTMGNKEDIEIFLSKNMSAWLLSERSERTMSLAIESAEAGQLFIDFAISQNIREQISGKQSLLTDTCSDYGYLELLTEREGEVLKLLCEGSNYKTVSKALFISESTVKTHINNIFTKLQINDRTQAVLYALKHDLEGLLNATMASNTRA
jgi:two-component system response regulator DegU